MVCDTDKLAHNGNPLPYALAGLAVIVDTIIWLRPPAPSVSASNAIKSVAAYADATGATGQFGDKDLEPVLARRCYLCHGAQVQRKNIRLGSAQHVKAYAQYIYQQAVVTRMMPMNNVTGITEAERLLIKQWFEAGARID